MQAEHQQIIDALSPCKRVLITTHVRPDGDALGSTAAMALGLRAKGIDATVLLLSRLPAKYAFVYEDDGVRHVDAEAGWPPSLDVAAFDALLVVDTGTWSQLPGLKDRLATFAGPKLVVDHHLTQEDWATAKLVDTKAAAAGEIVAGLLAAWGVALTPAIATALFLAVASDTGWFQFSSTRPATLRLGADLMEAGVDTDALQQRIYQNERPERLALQLRVQQSMRLLCDGRIAVMQCSADDYKATGAIQGDTEGLINVPLQISTVAVSLLLNDPGDGGPIRGSLRSKGGLDCAAFAQQYGGGGHARAAGLRVPGPAEDAYRTVVAALAAAVGCAASSVARQ
jgi:phosphoesterase RecJ-like protein